MSSGSAKIEEGHLGILDGLRGAMAFWVFYGHLHIVCFGTPPRFGHPANAVDVFMFLSGFLMTYHWLARQAKFDSRVRQSVDFYTRRFFRIAPIYYLLFTIAFLGQRYFFQMAGVSSAATGDPGPSDHVRNLANALAHYSFAFGAFPQYVSNNALPDWSIGLEMQFYLFFPFILLVIARLGPLTTVGMMVVVVYITNHSFSLYDNPPAALGNFPQPGFLPFKLDIFLAGICFAFSYREVSARQKVYWILLGAVCLLRTSVQVKALVAGTVCLIYFDSHRNDAAHQLLASRLGKFAGDTSYSVYLLHLLMMHPIRNWLLASPRLAKLPELLLFIITLLLIAIPLYLTAAALHRFIEVPGISIGRKVAQTLDGLLLRRLSSGRQVYAVARIGTSPEQ